MGLVFKSLTFVQLSNGLVFRPPFNYWTIYSPLTEWWSKQGSVKQVVV